MTTYPPTPAPAPPRATVSDATTTALWILRILTGIQAIMLLAQPVFAGRFLDGDYPALSTHGSNGLALTALAWLVVLAAVLAWRPGRLPAWPIALACVCSFGFPVQLGMGYSRHLAVHLTLGVGLVATGLALAIWAWWPGRARRSYRARRPRPMVDGGARVR
ncbi:hypothetical protein [Occultella gossypii]|uniref:Integral membrane protein n=1 Tax=Occultella gossypii TaxID=2800820 RepID=A0ABS7S3M2_9MICO|nr:hypothetical protein [Occultella gossypii]MBZ2194941.1 hypothetical protein [Occultella gossypii]